MSNIIPFNRGIKSSKTPKSVPQSNLPTSSNSFMDAVDKDTHNLATATGKTLEEAIQIASDFYRRYPMLVEYVRSPEYLLRNK